MQDSLGPLYRLATIGPKTTLSQRPSGDASAPDDQGAADAEELASRSSSSSSTSLDSESDSGSERQNPARRNRIASLPKSYEEELAALAEVEAKQAVQPGMAAALAAVEAVVEAKQAVQPGMAVVEADAVQPGMAAALAAVEAVVEADAVQPGMAVAAAQAAKPSPNKDNVCDKLLCAENIDNIAILYANALHYQSIGEIEGALTSYSSCSAIIQTIIISLGTNTAINTDVSTQAINRLKAHCNIGIDNTVIDIRNYLANMLQLALGQVSTLQEALQSKQAACDARNNDDDETKDWEKECIAIARAKPNMKLFFKDLAGSAVAKKQITETLIEPLLYPNLYPDPGKGFLLYGPPGTGKTYLMKAAINELQKRDNSIQVLFFTPTAADFKGKYVGETEQKITKWFNCASKAAADCENSTDGVKFISILFIDEIESVARDRSSDTSSHGGNSVTTLLQMMDGVIPYDNVAVVGATNYPWDLDNAILRRFDTQILLDIPPADVILNVMDGEFQRFIKFKKRTQDEAKKRWNGETKKKDTKADNICAKAVVNESDKNKTPQMDQDDYNQFEYSYMKAKGSSVLNGIASVMTNKKNRCSFSDVSNVMKVAAGLTAKQALDNGVFYNPKNLRGAVDIGEGFLIPSMNLPTDKNARVKLMEDYYGSLMDLLKEPTAGDVDDIKSYIDGKLDEFFKTFYLTGKHGKMYIDIPLSKNASGAPHFWRGGKNAKKRTHERYFNTSLLLGADPKIYTSEINIANTFVLFDPYICIFAHRCLAFWRAEEAFNTGDELPWEAIKDRLASTPCYTPDGSGGHSTTLMSGLDKNEYKNTIEGFMTHLVSPGIPIAAAANLAGAAVGAAAVGTVGAAAAVAAGAVAAVAADTMRYNYDVRKLFISTFNVMNITPKERSELISKTGLKGYWFSRNLTRDGGNWLGRGNTSGRRVASTDFENHQQINMIVNYKKFIHWDKTAPRRKRAQTFTSEECCQRLAKIDEKFIFCINQTKSDLDKIIQGFNLYTGFGNNGAKRVALWNDISGSGGFLEKGKALSKIKTYGTEDAMEAVSNQHDGRGGWYDSWINIQTMQLACKRVNGLEGPGSVGQTCDAIVRSLIKINSQKTWKEAGEGEDAKRSKSLRKLYWMLNYRYHFLIDKKTSEVKKATAAGSNIMYFKETAAVIAATVATQPVADTLALTDKLEETGLKNLIDEKTKSFLNEHNVDDFKKVGIHNPSKIISDAFREPLRYVSFLESTCITHKESFDAETAEGGHKSSESTNFALYIYFGVKIYKAYFTQFINAAGSHHSRVNCGGLIDYPFSNPSCSGCEINPKLDSSNQYIWDYVHPPTITCGEQDRYKTRIRARLKIRTYSKKPLPNFSSDPEDWRNFASWGNLYLAKYMDVRERVEILAEYFKSEYRYNGGYDMNKAFIILWKLSKLKRKSFLVEELEAFENASGVVKYLAEQSCVTAEEEQVIYEMISHSSKFEYKEQGEELEKFLEENSFRKVVLTDPSMKTFSVWLGTEVGTPPLQMTIEKKIEVPTLLPSVTSLGVTPNSESGKSGSPLKYPSEMQGYIMAEVDWKDYNFKEIHDMAGWSIKFNRLYALLKKNFPLHKEESKELFVDLLTNLNKNKIPFLTHMGLLATSIGIEDPGKQEIHWARPTMGLQAATSGTVGIMGIFRLVTWIIDFCIESLLSWIAQAISLIANVKNSNGDPDTGIGQLNRWVTVKGVAEIMKLVIAGMVVCAAASSNAGPEYNPTWVNTMLSTLYTVVQPLKYNSANDWVTNIVKFGGNTLAASLSVVAAGVLIKGVADVLASIVEWFITKISTCYAQIKIAWGRFSDGDPLEKSQEVVSLIILCLALGGFILKGRIGKIYKWVVKSPVNDSLEWATSGWWKGILCTIIALILIVVWNSLDSKLTIIVFALIWIVSGMRAAEGERDALEAATAPTPTPPPAPTPTPPPAPTPGACHSGVVPLASEVVTLDGCGDNRILGMDRGMAFKAIGLAAGITLPVLTNLLVTTLGSLFNIINKARGGGLGAAGKNAPIFNKHFTESISQGWRPKKFHTKAYSDAKERLSSRFIIKSPNLEDTFDYRVFTNMYIESFNKPVGYLDNFTLLNTAKWEYAPSWSDNMNWAANIFYRSGINTYDNPAKITYSVFTEDKEEVQRLDYNKRDPVEMRSRLKCIDITPANIIKAVSKMQSTYDQGLGDKLKAYQDNRIEFLENHRKKK